MPAEAYGFATVAIGAAGSVVISIALVWILSSLIKRADPKQHLRSLLYDEKGYASLTHFQFVSWTFVFLFSLLWIYLVRIQGDVLGFPPGIPANTLILMGINTASAVASKAISGKRYGHLTKLPSKGSLWKMLYESDEPSLARAQLFLWTLASLIIYALILISIMFGPFLFNFSQTPLSALGLPDVDPSLVTLMGLSHVGFLGRKYYK